MEEQPEEAKDFPFEDSLGQLEELVGRLEAGELSLEESLQDFERGVALVRQLRARLDRAQQRVDRIMEQEDGELAGRPLELDDAAEPKTEGS